VCDGSVGGVVLYSRTLYSVPLFAGQGQGREEYMGYMEWGDLGLGLGEEKAADRVVPCCVLEVMGRWADTKRYKEMRYLLLEVIGVVGGVVEVLRRGGYRPLLHGVSLGLG